MKGIGLLHDTSTIIGVVLCLSAVFVVEEIGNKKSEQVLPSSRYI